MERPLEYSWQDQDVPYEVTQDYARSADPMWLAFKRFTSRSTGALTILSLSFDLDADLSSIFEDLPGWLETFAGGDGRAELLFAAQGHRSGSARQALRWAHHAVRPLHLPRQNFSGTAAAGFGPGEPISDGVARFFAAVLDELLAIEPALLQLAADALARP